MIDIIAGLSGLKTATDLTKTLRDGLKSGKMKADEVAKHVGEIYDLIVDSKAALSDARDEMSRLQDELIQLKSFRDDFELRDNVYWRKGTNDAYCPLCLADKAKAVPLQNNGNLGWYCGIHNKSFHITPTTDWPGFAIVR